MRCNRRPPPATAHQQPAGPCCRPAAHLLPVVHLPLPRLQHKHEAQLARREALQRLPAGRSKQEAERGGERRQGLSRHRAWGSVVLQGCHQCRGQACVCMRAAAAAAACRRGQSPTPGAGGAGVR
jgi:hypothetical protein